VLSSFSTEVSMAYRELGMIELREVGDAGLVFTSTSAVCTRLFGDLPRLRIGTVDPLAAAPVPASNWTVGALHTDDRRSLERYRRPRTAS
jgi:hypothetical protein